MLTFYIIGITDNPQAFFTPEVTDIIRQGHVFSGGARHHELVRHLLPDEHIWIDIAPPMSEVFEAYRRYANIPLGSKEPVVVFASGDPLFYGFAFTVKRMEPDAIIRVFPTFNSLQLLAHRMLLPYGTMRTVSQTGRPWQPLDEALIGGESLIGVLTDRQKTPDLIAQRMIAYDYTNYRMTVGECLGNPQRERIRRFTLREASACREWQQPCCLVLEQTTPRPRPFGIPDAAFHLLNGRQNMITKAPLRLLVLSALDLPRRKCLWDIGFCTGSISIESRLQFPHLSVEAFEKRPEGRELMTLNSRRFGVPGIGVHIGDFMQESLAQLPHPDAVFIGGHGGQLTEMVARVREYLLPGGVIVFNSVSEASARLFRQAAGDCEEFHVALEGHYPIRIMKKCYE